MSFHSVLLFALAIGLLTAALTLSALSGLDRAFPPAAVEAAR